MAEVELDSMPMPKFHGLVKVIFHLIAVAGCLAGVFIIIEGYRMFGTKMMTGSWALEQIFIASIYGVLVIILSLTVLGLAYGYLAMVKAQIDTRNAIISYTQLKTAHCYQSTNQNSAT